jgi:malate dehydrogenase
MERSDLLQGNAAIFNVQGKALNDQASRDVKVIVVGNPANTNALITQKNAPDLNSRNFTAMTRLDHNRALAQLAAKTSSSVNDIKNLCIWGNHSTTQYPDISHAMIAGSPALEKVERSWYQDEYIPRVAKRGAEIIAARGASSAASAANAALEHMRDWILGSEGDNWVSMGVPSDGSYDIPEGLVYSFPVTCKNGDYEIVQGLEIDEFSRAMMTATQEELEEERDMVKHLFA